MKAKLAVLGLLVVALLVWAVLMLERRIDTLERTEWRLVTVTNSEGWAWSEVHKFSKP